MKTCRDCALFNNCEEPYTESEIIEYTTGDIRTLCKLFEDIGDYSKITKCKDCRQYLPSGRCWKVGGIWSADDYCSKAERKVK
jgi:hypothetical protein